MFLKHSMRFRNTASVYSTCIIIGFGALLTASKTYSNGSYKEMQKSKKSKTLKQTRKTRRKEDTKNQHLYVYTASENNAELLTRTIFDCKL